MAGIAAANCRATAAASCRAATTRYLPTLGVDKLVDNAYAVSYLAAAFAPLFFGFLADRYLPAQIVLAGLHLIGAGVMYAVSQASPDAIVPLIFAHMCCFAPTLGLTNAVAFNALTDSEKQFPIVRVFGTVGWIVAGCYVGGSLLGWYSLDFLRAEGTPPLEEGPGQYLVTAIAGVVMAVYSLTLPNTPPAAKGEPFSIGKLFGADAWGLLRDRSFATFLLCTVLICLPLSLYYSKAAFFAGLSGIENSTAALSWGQVSEVAFMLAMPLFFARLGVKWMLLVGMLSWVVRYGLFAGAWPGDVAWMIYLGILLHGICYDFFFVTGQIYVDRAAPKAVRSQAQSLLVLMTYGVGFTVGSYLGGPYTDLFKDADAVAKLDAAQAAVDAAQTLTPALEAALADAAAEVNATIDWRNFWIWPAAFAGGVAMLFFALFREPAKREDPVVESQPAAA